MFGFHENLYILRKTKSLPDEFYQGWKNDLEKNLQQPGFLLYWQEHGDEFASGFRDYISAILIHNISIDDEKSTNLRKTNTKL